MPETRVAELYVLGYYSQLYNSIIQSGQVWRVSKYFLRRWGPYLGPTRFWTVITARQLCYRNGDRDWFAGYDATVADAVHLSRAHYRRLKAEMDEPGGPLSLFITREPTTYHVINGKTRPQPTVYRVRLDDPLTPADAAFLAGWLRTQTVKRRADDVADLLRQAAEVARQELLDPYPAPTSLGGPAAFEPVTVHQVVRQVYGGHIADQPVVVKAAEALHAHLTGGDFLGKQYFRREWLSRLKAGPAYLQMFLRSLCFFNEQTGELRNRVVIDRQALAQKLAVKPNTVSDWLKTLATAAPDQPLPPFLHLVEKGRTAENRFTFTYQVGMLDPLTAADLHRYEEAAAARPPDLDEDVAEGYPTLMGQSENELHEEGSEIRSRSENELHGKVNGHRPQSEIELHEAGELCRPPSEFATHGHPQTPSESENDRHTSRGQFKNERHAQGVNPNLHQGQPQNEPGSIPECASFKYFPTLLKLPQEQTHTWLLAAGRSELAEKGIHSLTSSICRDDIDRLADFLGVDPGSPTRRRLRQSGLTPDMGVAWWLYAHTQPGLERPEHFVIARAAAGVEPPEPFAALARLPLEAWVCFVLSAGLPVDFRPDWSADPAFEAWWEIYGERQTPMWPPGVGEWAAVVADEVYELRRNAVARPPESISNRAWAEAKQALALVIDEPIYDIFVTPLEAEVDAASGHLVVTAPDETGRAYVARALLEPLKHALAAAAGRDVTLEIRAVEKGEVPAKSIRISDLEDTWREARDALALQMNPATYDRWLRESRLIEREGGRWTIEVESEAAQAWLDGRLRPLIERTVKRLAGDPTIEITFVTRMAAS